MTDQPNKETHVARPVERHLAAAWAGIGKQKPVTNVTIPSSEGIADAKEYVDSNEK